MDGPERSIKNGEGACSRAEFNVLAERIEALRILVESQRADDRLAVTKALSSADKLADKHNDLIRQMQERDKAYATKEDMSRLEEDYERLRENSIPSVVYDQRHEGLVEAVKSVEKEQDRSAGSRRTLTLGLAVIVTLLSLSLGITFARIPTSQDISDQITRETPKPVVADALSNLDKRLSLLESTEAQEHANIKVGGTK